MREVLFKGFHKDENGNEKIFIHNKWVKGYWVTGDLIQDRNENEQNRYKIGFYYNCELVMPETICQFTGYLDKNEQQIFENDILAGDEYPFTSDGERNYFAEVSWWSNTPGLGLYTFKNPSSNVRGLSTGDTNDFSDFKPMHWEVIGNIFNNPELQDEI